MYIDIVKNVLNNIGIDLLCVATHYSERYSNADNYFPGLQDIKNENNIKNWFIFIPKLLISLTTEIKVDIELFFILFQIDSNSSFVDKLIKLIHHIFVLK